MNLEELAQGSKSWRTLKRLNASRPATVAFVMTAIIRTVSPVCLQKTACGTVETRLVNVKGLTRSQIFHRPLQSSCHLPCTMS